MGPKRFRKFRTDIHRTGPTAWAVALLLSVPTLTVSRPEGLAAALVAFSRDMYEIGKV